MGILYIAAWVPCPCVTIAVHNMSMSESAFTAAIWLLFLPLLSIDVMKRKLAVDGTPAEQFACLREIPGLSAADCREVIARLRDDGKGVTTCRAPAVKFPVAHKMLQAVKLPGPKGLTVHCNSLSMLVAEKVQRSPLYATLLQAAMKASQNQLTLIIFSDEANPGNVLHARHPRKTNLVYASFLELPVVFVDSMWLPLSAVRADDVTTHETSYAEIMRHVLESVWQDTEHGVTVCFGDSAHLCFIKRVLLLNDHEGLRSVTGAKGSAGVKCCCHCINVLSLGRECPEGYVDISESSISKFVQQTDDGLAAVQRRLAMCQTKKELAQVETLLGWNADSLSKSIFSSDCLSSWIQMDSLYLDAMHQYQSGGMVGQEIGCWYTRFVDCGYSISLLQQWTSLGWSAAHGYQPPTLAVNEKLFRYEQDYRGDANACSTMLPLLWAFCIEVLVDVEAMATACTSLAALYDVVRCLQRCKIDVANGAQLMPLQRRHMMSFQEAYGASHTRPKAHYALHLAAQMQRWQRHIDCHVGERKHRLFKRYVGPKISKLEGYAKSVLLHLTDMELSNPEPKERWTGQVLGVLREQPETAKRVGLPTSALFANGIEIGCVEFGRGTFLRISKTVCVEIIGCVVAEPEKFLLVQPLHWHSASYSYRFPKWKKADGQLALTPLHMLKGQEPFRLIRQDRSGVWLLR